MDSEEREKGIEKGKLKEKLGKKGKHQKAYAFSLSEFYIKRLCMCIFFE